MSERLAATEAVNTATRDLDTLSSEALVALLARQQRTAFAALESALPALARAVDIVVKRLEAGGNLHYAGAGTSGRLGMLDAAECPPTFGTSPTLVRAHVAGGSEALVRAVEGAEDDARAGEAEAHREVRPGDAVVGVSASGGAPWVVAWVRAARDAGAATIAITSEGESALACAAETSIVLATGAEPIAGSTRLIAGTAQKLALNALSTAVMVRLGKVYDNLMVDVVATNAKLRARALRLVRALAGVDESTASKLLESAGGSVKVAVVMARRKVDAATARALLERERGRLRKLIASSSTIP
jgi:N-acetylmuramic acid 6-phosphate etherase